MNKPFWFHIIKQWKEMGKGEYGVTIPFLVGALASHFGKEPTKEFVDETFENIKSNPVNGYYCEVRWCGNIDEPVISVKEIDELADITLEADYKFGGIVSLGFTMDLMGMFHLNCETAHDCLLKLITYSLEHVSQGCFSKNSGKFTSFTDDDLVFINLVEELSST
ncbi:hypothetical protein [uncultured Pseudoalteromonas sp.]|uniref:hypothetical protein n=1 Tax=uncultured Pseudoalteromonas sp. TaxID=114053 RepID=UPI00260F5743|nr:hypothetical protein [uncultured Pseudoalteromonas sp.]